MPLSLYITNNLGPLLLQLQTHTKQWRDLPLDLMGRANVLKMIYLPKLLYVLAISPCKIPKTIFKSIDSICITFLWNGKSPRVALETLRLPSHLAGLAFPDFYLYYQASQLVNIHDWLLPDSNNACTTTEGW